MELLRPADGTRTEGRNQAHENGTSKHFHSSPLRQAPSKCLIHINPTNPDTSMQHSHLTWEGTNKRLTPLPRTHLTPEVAWVQKRL